MSGGEGGIRTLEGLLTLTPLAGERFQPLSHLSGNWPDYLRRSRGGASSTSLRNRDLAILTRIGKAAQCDIMPGRQDSRRHCREVTAQVRPLATIRV